MENTHTNSQKRARIFIFAAFVILVIIFAVYAVIYALSAPGKKMLSREEIETNLDLARGQGDEGHSYASTYLEEWGIRGYDTSKLKTCEYFFNRYSIYEMKGTEELAISTAELFMEYFFDKIDKEDRTAVTDALLNCYVEAVGDKYAVYRTASQFEDYNTDMSGSFVGIGVQVRYSEEDGTITVISVNENSAAEEAGILAGDVIYAVDGVTVEELGYEGAVSKIRGEIGTDVTITVKRDDETIDLVATRIQITEQTVKYLLTEDKIAILTITGFKGNTAEQFREAIDRAEREGARGIVFDMRDNPGGYLNSVVEVIDYLAPEGARIASYTSSTEGETVFVSDDGHSVNLPFAVVFNEYTASAGELFSAAMRDYGDMGIFNAVTVGAKTYSKGVMQSTLGFADKSTLTMTIAFYNPPCNVNYDGIGVTPDFEELEPEAQLERAISELKALIN